MKLSKETNNRGDGFFSGNRSVFWFFSVLGFLALFPWWLALVFDPMIWNSDLVYFLVPVSAVYLFLSIGLFHPKKNRWSLKIVCGILILASSIYVAAEIPDVVSGKEPFWGGLGTDTLGNALGMFLIVGIPCMRYIFTKAKK
ncbi:MAG: hypothetical protein JXR76_10165 [Deltaproteobacteria bacterium]|nr:hypothetical protein [Deltaproteobacteria bacterium]